MLKKAVLFPFLFFSMQVIGQKLEIGANSGLLQYKGDLQPNYRLLSGMPAAGLFARYNFPFGLSVKGQGYNGFLRGRDKRLGSPPLHRLRDNSFSSYMYAMGGQLEYNFLNFRKTSSLKKNESTLYLFTGFETQFHNHLAFYQIEGSTGLLTLQPNPTDAPSLNAINLGFGFKKVWKSNWNIGIEFGARSNWHGRQSTNTDISIDGIGGVLLAQGQKDKRKINKTPGGSTQDEIIEHAKLMYYNTDQLDKVFYLNVSVSYVFYKVKCPSPR